ncbi:hypothetical protein GCM10010218_35910 [Streptomyces mashuensis]|uniref:Multi-component regulatory system-8 n=1 Tax=Streptomyces mashuensis TaxID=33904 RepID=A0A919EDR1_9ACTN|nr:DUF742 domain-containing protein [Streptomyces mashuensis]GHF51182.1 hypothetical protein GCM10010218_35910 [Streptomyces mashuensis]
MTALAPGTRAPAPSAPRPPVSVPAPRRGGGAGRRAARVRPYSVAGGRGGCGHLLLLETFVAAYGGDGVDGPPGRGLPEAGAVVRLCRRLRSVAEVAALLRMPLGVVRLLLADLADQGRIRVYGSGHATGRPDRLLLERVLSGLRRL